MQFPKRKQPTQYNDEAKVEISEKEYNKLKRLRDTVRDEYGICSNTDCQSLICLKRTTLEGPFGREMPIYTSTLFECTSCKKSFCNSCCIIAYMNEMSYIGPYCRDCEKKDIHDSNQKYESSKSPESSSFHEDDYLEQCYD